MMDHETSFRFTTNYFISLFILWALPGTYIRLRLLFFLTSTEYDDR